MSSLLKKREEFKTQIRRQSLNRLFSLKRIKPKLIQSPQQALTILVDGLDILKKSQNDEELIEALRSMTLNFKIYDFVIFPKMIKQSIENAKWLVSDYTKIDMIKEQGLQLLTILGFNYPNQMTFNDIPFQVLEGFNLKMIRSALIASCQLISNFQIINSSMIKQNIFDSRIFKRLNLVLANFIDKKECFEYIQIPFLSFSISLCFLAFNWNINKDNNDFQRLLQFCTIKLEKNILNEAQKDPALTAFFQKFHKSYDHQNCYDEIHQLSYPFQSLSLTTRIIQQFNVDVLAALSQCLSIQLQNNNVQKCLLRCLINIFKETNTVLEDQLRKRIFQYIFEMKYVENQNEGCLKEIIILAVNNSVNDQTMDESIFEAMGDRNHKRYPETCHLLQLMEYLEDKEDFSTQKLLLELIQNYITYNGDTKYIQECQYELVNFQEGAKLLERLGFQLDIEQIQQSQEVLQI